MENSDIKKEPPEEILSIIEVKEERIEEIDQSNIEIASKNSEEKHKGYFEPKIEAKDIIKYSKVQKKRKKAQKNEFSCELCNKRLSSKYNLKTHIASVHEKKKRVRKKPFQCDICCAYFCSKGVLNTHITSVHEGKKEFQCSRKGTSNCTNSIFVMVAFSVESEPSWLELKDFQLGSARDLFLFSSKSKIGQTHKNTLKITSNLLYYIESIFR